MLSRNPLVVLAVFLLVGLLSACSSETGDSTPQEQALPDSTEGTRRMAERLEALAQEGTRRGNLTVGMKTRIAQRRLAVENAGSLRDSQIYRMTLAYEFLRAGRTVEAIAEFLRVQSIFDEHKMANPIPSYHSFLATAFLRLAEQSNCLERNNSDSCLLPIRGNGIHGFKDGSRKAIDHLMASLARNPRNLADRWLLNLAHMTLGEYPEKPEEPYLIPPSVFASDYDIGRFDNIAFDAGVAIHGLGGGSVMEDFDGDGYLDIIASDWGMRAQMRYFRNQGNGSFTERTKEAGLLGEVGGLNISQADYDNDGDADLLVLRGAWQGARGRWPNSLLRNNGDGTFEDVTEEAGLLALHPTQTGVWGDFDNDGWLDLFIGNESGKQSTDRCQLFRNNGDGTFSDVAKQFGVDHIGYVKGAAWGDYDNDGRLDLYLSQLDAANILYRNEGGTGESWKFRDVTATAGVAEPHLSFPTWFWDYDNDGWLDLFAGSFPGFSGDTLDDIVAGYLGKPFKAPYSRLYRNSGDGTFADVTKPAGLAAPMLIMGANFGDIDNDGFPDFYLGTGEPNLHTQVPNRMYRNDGSGRFQNVTTSGGFGHLQKGHGISFGDIDNDGDQDVYAVMGGAYQGDVAYNALFRNPGHDNHWISLSFEGVRSNRSGVGVRVEVIVNGPSGGRRTITATVGTGGSFGSSSLRQQIGLGDADRIETIKVWWPTSGEKQTYHHIGMDRFYRVREGADELIPLTVRAPALH
jgi:hypothetical protein